MKKKINIWFHNNSNSNDKYSIFLYVRKHYLIIQFQFFQIIKESRNQERRILISWYLPDHEEFSWIEFVNLSWSRRIFVNIGAVDWSCVKYVQNVLKSRKISIFCIFSTILCIIYACYIHKNIWRYTSFSNWRYTNS